MKRVKFILPLLVLTVIMSACNTVRYSANDLDRKKKSHQQIAILPSTVIHRGNNPRLSEEQLATMQNAESRICQTEIYNALLRKAGKNVLVDVQDISRTNSILQNQDITHRKAWDMEPAELARILGVDAVVKFVVDENRFRPDGIGDPNVYPVLRTVPAHQYLWRSPHEPSTARVQVMCSIYHSDGSLLWRLGKTRNAFWHEPTKEIIEDISRKVARNFPYTRK